MTGGGLRALSAGDERALGGGVTAGPQGPRRTLSEEQQLVKWESDVIRFVFYVSKDEFCDLCPKR